MVLMGTARPRAGREEGKMRGGSPRLQGDGERMRGGVQSIAGGGPTPGREKRGEVAPAPRGMRRGCGAEFRVLLEAVRPRAGRSGARSPRLQGNAGRMRGGVQSIAGGGPTPGRERRGEDAGRVAPAPGGRGEDAGRVAPAPMRELLNRHDQGN